MKKKLNLEKIAKELEKLQKEYDFDFQYHPSLPISILTNSFEKLQIICVN